MARQPCSTARLLASVLFVVLSACSLGSTAPNFVGDVSPEVAEVQSGLLVPLSDSSAISPTIEFFTGGLTSRVRRERVEGLVARCMSNRGWDYEPVVDDRPPSPEPRTIGELREYRSRYGYGEFTQPPAPRSDDGPAERNWERLQALTEEQRIAYLTDLAGSVEAGMEDLVPSPGSCRKEAADVMGLPSDNAELMESMQEQYLATRDSVDLRAARSAWSACMAERGYDVSEPADAFRLVVSHGTDLAQSPVEFELAVAVADFECASTSLLPMEHLLESRIVANLKAAFPE